MDVAVNNKVIAQIIGMALVHSISLSLNLKYVVFMSTGIHKWMKSSFVSEKVPTTRSISVAVNVAVTKQRGHKLGVKISCGLN